MKKIVFLVVIVGALLTYSIAFAASMTVKSSKDGVKLSMMEGMDHSKMEGMDHSMMKSDEPTTDESKGIKTVEQDGYKFRFEFVDIREKVKGMEGSSMGMMTHHLMVTIEDPDGEQVADAKVMYKTFAPGGKEAKARAMKMGAAFGGNVNLSEKGKHRIEATVKIGDKEVLVKIHYETK